MLMLAAGSRFRAALLMSVTLRVLFHAYYGPSVIFLAVWATVAVLVVWRTGCLLGVTIAHCAWNILNILVQLLPDAWALIPAVTTFAVAIYGIREFYRGARRFNAEPGGQLP